MQQHLFMVKGVLQTGLDQKLKIIPRLRSWFFNVNKPEPEGAA